MLSKLSSLFASVAPGKSDDPNELLRSATALKKSGDLDAAIAALKEAYRCIAAGQVNYTVEPFLRLPMYLQAAGRADEAWGEFNQLLAKGYPNQMKIPELLPMDHMQIYDKMRVFLEREKRLTEAVAFGLAAYLSRAVGFYRQKRTSELQRLSSDQMIQSEIDRLIKKRGTAEQKQALAQEVHEQLASVPQITIAKMMNNVARLLK